jgi:benzylsuccinate CoA-transferase BbsE subunit
VLDDLRVLELSSPDTMMAGKVLADLGADVVVVEPPGGSPGRRLAPFVDGLPGLESGLTWLALNRQKRAITLDTTTADGRALLQRLGERADVVIEAVGPAPAIPVSDEVRWPEPTIRCVIHPFSATGPKSDYAAGPVVLAAAAGALALAGDPDRAPVGFPVPQSYAHSGADAAIAVLAALAARDDGAAGQSTSVSARIASLITGFSQPIVVTSGSTPARRVAAASALPSNYPCRDGYALVTLAFGAAFGPLTRRIADWVDGLGLLASDLRGVDWTAVTPDRPEAAALATGVAAACAASTKAEVEDAARSRGFLAAAVHDAADVLAAPAYRERGLWAEVPVPGRAAGVLGPVHFPRFSKHTVPDTRGAPRLGEHNVEVLGGELALDLAELGALFTHGII